MTSEEMKEKLEAFVANLTSKEVIVDLLKKSGVKGVRADLTKCWLARLAQRELGLDDEAVIRELVTVSGGYIHLCNWKLDDPRYGDLCTDIRLPETVWDIVHGFDAGEYPEFEEEP